ncbi:hypothetical protein [Paraburkholderia rhynchosiae]|uniref:Lipoprotein n=1 Tax=Paraburkholderia rhynchosiae TaxID=487049 RepID=A0A2N7WKK1_9BURK|nr:hypothetical protein [Paraburkholderia rhynchosiae]PMS29805.1 hypothetical protein C0Z16_17680 [Paraburkholderia rhynchosiae]CAB3697129.1 hypothetical protein LMG27174_03470 [Paraburkholderia rhynchosiae]
MNTLKVAGVALVLCMSSAACAQQSGNAPANSGAQTGKEVQPGQAGRTVDEPAALGAPGNKPGSLMDKRANALSPEGASSPRTGEVKQ